MTRTQKIEALTENYVDTLVARAARRSLPHIYFLWDEQIDEWEHLLTFPIAPATEIKTTAEVIAVYERDEVALDLVALIETWGMEDDADDNLKGGAFEGVTNIGPATFHVRRGGKTYKLTVVEV